MKETARVRASSYIADQVAELAMKPGIDVLDPSFRQVVADIAYEVVTEQDSANDSGAAITEAFAKACEVLDALSTSSTRVRVLKALCAIYGVPS